MRILYVTPYVPTPVRRRPFELLRSLAARGHQLTLACLWERADELEALAVFRDLGIEVRAQRMPQARRLGNLLRAGLVGWPLQAGYDRHPALYRDLDALVSRAPGFDVAHVEHLRGAQFGLRIRDRIPVLWDSVDCISRLFVQAGRQARDRRTRMAARLELSRTRRFEGRAARGFPRTLVTSSADADALRHLAAHDSRRPSEDAHIAVLQNGVDATYFRPDPERGRDPATVLMTGKMSYHANVAAAHVLVEEVMPRIWASCPQAQAVIAGASPAPSIRALERRHRGRVHVSGAVPDLRPLLQTATIAMAPMPYGVGIQNKVLEAMACATPVVAGVNVIRELNLSVGEDACAGSNVQELADEAIALLQSPARAQRIGLAGREFVLRDHRWEDMSSSLEGHLAELCARKGSSG